ncbi:MAG TPA: hypothetical protein VG125_01575 [Pirellulales bacterium]|jgi:hypothetical protein|nr:hypothetical protein [Pirellulales bacterium]
MTANSEKDELLTLLAQVPRGHALRPVASEARKLLAADNDWSFHVDRRASLPAIHFFEIYARRRSILRQRGRLADYHGLAETVDTFAATGDAINFVGADSPTYFITLFLSAVDSHVVGCIWSRRPTARKATRH